MSCPQSPPPDLKACLAMERRIDATRLEAWQSDIRRRSGVCLSGFDPDPPRLRSEAELRAAARRRRQQGGEPEGRDKVLIFHCCPISVKDIP